VNFPRGILAAIYAALKVEFIWLFGCLFFFASLDGAVSVLNLPCAKVALEMAFADLYALMAAVAGAGVLVPHDVTRSAKALSSIRHVANRMAPSDPRRR
jgi:hypothetical protein